MTHLGRFAKSVIENHKNKATSEVHYLCKEKRNKGIVYIAPYYMDDLTVSYFYDWMNGSYHKMYTVDIRFDELPYDVANYLRFRHNIQVFTDSSRLELNLNGNSKVEILAEFTTH